MAEGRDSSQVATPADRAVSHTQVMAGQPSLAIVPQLTFHNDVLVEVGQKVSASLDGNNCVSRI